jgi:hypothetical protein
MVPLTGGAPTMLVSGTTTPSFTGASLIATVGGNLYWAANSTVFPNPPSVFTAPVAGGTQVAVDTSPSYIPGLLATGGSVYYGAMNDLKSVTPPSTTPAALTTAFFGFDLAFDGASFFWHDGRDGMPNNITTVPRAGGVPSVLAMNTGNMGNFSDLVADATTLYWGALLADQSAAIKSMPVGGGTQTVFEDPLPFSEDALALDDTNVYVMSGGFVWKKAKAGGPLICLSASKAGSGANLLVDATNVYWPDQQTQRIMKVAK